MPTSAQRTLLTLTALLCTALCAPGAARAASVSFLVDPVTIDTSPMDGFITGSEFQPVGDDGVNFDLLPTNNLVGGDRFLLALTTGIQFGGGGGSTLEFEFTTDTTIQLESYTLPNSGFILNDPVFDIRDGVDILSLSNTAVDNGDTHNFNSGPVLINAGTTYTFIATNTGAGIQSFMESWQYSVVPEPASAALLGVGLLCVATRRKQSPARR